MQKNIIQSLWKPLLALSVIGIIIIISVVPFIFNETTIKDATLVAQNTAQQYSSLRSYYTKNIVSKLKASDQITISSDYKDKKHGIPLPATMIHELSELSESSGLKIKLYSAFPFPERANRKLDTFQKQAWQKLSNNPNDPYVTIEKIDDKHIVRVAIADILTEQACVQCHNSHPETPKVGWELGDVRGVLEVIVPIDQQLSWQQNGSYQLTIIFILIFFVIFYVLLRLLSNESSNRVSDVLIPLKNQKFAMNAHSLLSMTDEHGNIIYVNDKFSKITGYTREELIGKKHNVHNSKNQPTSYWKDMYNIVLSGKAWHDEVRNKAKDGHFYWIDTTIVPNYDKNKKINGFTSISTDITQQKQNIENLAIAKEQAEVANDSKADFLANMSHEIRTPMNGVIGMTNLLIDSELSQEQNKLANTVKSSAVGLLSIINDILDFSKVEAGKLELELIPFNLGQMVGDTGASISFQAHLKGLQFICPATPIIQQWVTADPGRIRQILTNLIGNAIKFTNQGEVAVYVHLIEQTAEKKHFRFEIKDTGIGISESQQAQLFDKFSQADSSTNRKYGGTGLGLSISKKLVELMDGEIGIDSEIGRGSTFWFTLPLLNAQAIDNTPAYSADLKKERILIVDDNETNLELMHQLHKIWGIPHKLVNSAKAALAELAQASQDNIPFTMAILDMHMPEIDGLELCQQIQKTPQIAKTKLIMASSQAQRGDALKMKEAGFKGYITKPIQQSELLDVLLMVSGIEISTPEFVTRHSTKEHVQFKAHLLVVEDNATNQLVIEGLLRALGITVDLAGNGKEALAALQSVSKHDLVFMDCQMPVLDGYQATRKIRSKESAVTNSEIPIIAMTANAMAGDRQKCLDAGMNDYLSKPIEADKVINMLKKWLPNESTEINQPATEDNPKLATLDKTANEHIVFDYDDMSKRLMNDQDLMKSIAEMFYQDLVVEIEELKVSIKNNDIKQAAAIMHIIKGSAANVGGKALTALAFDMEMASKSGNLLEIENNIEQLEYEFNRLKLAMKKAFS
jgi:PAS domain S-box-containing protein